MAKKFHLKRLLESWIRPWYGTGKVHILAFFMEFCGKSDLLQKYVTEAGSSNAVLKNNCSSWITYPKGYAMIKYFTMIKQLMIKQWIKQSIYGLFCILVSFDHVRHHYILTEMQGDIKYRNFGWLMLHIDLSSQKMIFKKLLLS